MEERPEWWIEFMVLYAAVACKSRNGIANPLVSTYTQLSLY